MEEVREGHMNGYVYILEEMENTEVTVVGKPASAQWLSFQTLWYRVDISTQATSVVYTF